MIYKLYSSTTDFLLKRSETGMGYQVIDAPRQYSYKTERFVVFNAELIVDFDNNFFSYKSRILNEGFKNILDKADYLSLSTDSLRVLSFSDIRESRILSESKKEKKQRYSGGKGAIDNPKIPANGDDFFVRLSAYPNDKRIDFENKCLKAGSFATTFLDYYKCVHAEDDPIDRYALPNDESIKWAFFIKPIKGELYQEGIVQPAFGHDGGGIEDYFADGTTKNTYLGSLGYGKFEK